MAMTPPPRLIRPFSRGDDGGDQALRALIKTLINLANQDERHFRKTMASHEAIEQTVRSEGMGTREALTIGWSSLQDHQRLMGRRMDGGLAEILQQLEDIKSTMNAMASVQAYHARFDPRDYEQDEEGVDGLD